jgi:hypothetical protein
MSNILRGSVSTLYLLSVRVRLTTVMLVKTTTAQTFVSPRTLVMVLLLFAPSVPAQTRPLTNAPAGPTIAGCPVFPPDNIWNTRIDRLPTDPHSQEYIQSIGTDRPLHPDFGWDNGPIGIPFVTVPGNQKRIRIEFDYREESDLSNYPIPPNAPIEGGPSSKGDRHVLVIDRDNCVLWEIFAAYPQPDGSWKAGSGAVFDLTCNCLRPDGWTSADAAGLPIFPGLVRYEEVASGEIKHAIRFTAQRTRNSAVWPARHAASRLTDASLPPLGQRFRLKATFSLSGFSREAQVILRALQTYGMILADNGSPWFISGAPNELWKNKGLEELRRVKGSNFEAIDESDLFVSHHSARARSNN